MDFSVEIINLVKELRSKHETEIALKEASETGYWLELLHRANYIDDMQYKSLADKCTTIRVMLVASYRTTKVNM